LRKVFEQQLDSVVGYVLPVKRTDDVDGRDRPGLDGPRWETGPWFFRDERMYLVPGDSPMGYRLPLDSLPWASRADYPYLVERDPFAQRDALPDAAAI
ncbi:transglutaminase family protein, partial [Burkholderia contaminans]